MSALAPSEGHRRSVLASCNERSIDKEEDMIEVAAPQNCSGCRLCALACSFYNSSQREFSLAAASIRIERVGNESVFRPRVLEDCIGCGVCVSYCEYGVLAEA